ncbi:dihydroorotase [Methanobacterium aggregans]|uniref:dihydroorotase n=1 Tax=Methanobacterium aggregans TaxID=1615586 RepID=UPI001AE23A54|nr:dihydroorotase family protein [Methanobacterium aggregans]MBP2046262.1 dihydroorotase [Methanobacterium aggregans]
MSDLALLNCNIPGINENCTVEVENGKIKSIKKIGPKCDKIIDLKGKILLPGLIDAHVHMRDPGLTYKEDWKTGSRAAASGGFTTVLDMPNTDPKTTTAERFKEKIQIAGSKSVVDFGLHAGVEKLDEIPKIAKLHPSSFKIFADIVDNGFLMDAFNEVSKLKYNPSTQGQKAEKYPFKPLISLHCEDKDIVRHCTDKLKFGGVSDSKVYSRARPALAEEVSVSNIVTMAEHSNIHVHICHVSTSKSLEIIRRAELAGCMVTCEATPHHLLLDSSSFEEFGTLAKTNPPLRDGKYRIKISDLDSIDIVGTDHAPHELLEKGRDVWNAPPGIPGLETALSLLLTQINRKELSFKRLIKLLSENPARIFNIPKKGSIKEGMDADFVVVDMKREGVVDPKTFQSKAEYSPFEGFQVKGMPVMTLVRGNVVMDEGEVFEKKGKFIHS